MTDPDPAPNAEGPDPEELLAESANRSRTDAADDQEDTPPLATVVADQLAAIDAGDANPNVTFRDERLRALVNALNETGDLNAVAAAAAEHLDRDAPADAGRSDVFRLLLRVGLQEAAPETAEAGVEGYRQHQQRQLEDANL